MTAQPAEALDVLRIEVLYVVVVAFKLEEPGKIIHVVVVSYAVGAKFRQAQGTSLVNFKALLPVLSAT